MVRSWYRRLHLLVIIVLIGTSPLFYTDPFASPAYAAPLLQGPNGSLPTLPPPLPIPPGPSTPPPPVPITVPLQPIVDPHLASLVLSLVVDPPVLKLGDTATISVTVFNQAPDPADDVVVTLPISP